ncbi:MAG: hypothetical protein QM762_09630 [Chryseolinea sp.]
MRFVLSIVVCVAAIMLMTSCTPAFYSTVGQNVPLFHSKGEVVVNAGIMSAATNSDAFNPVESLNPGIVLQTAVAIDSNAALIASYYNLSSDGNWKVSANYFELGGGLFTYKPKSRFVAELFLGAGYGAINNSRDQEVIDVDFLKYFLQPSVGISGKVLEVAFTPRFGVVDYLSNSPSTRSDVQQYFTEKATSFVFEPGITVRVGFKNFRAQYQMNYSTFHFDRPFQSSEFDPVMDCYGSLSFYVAINRRWSR